MKKSIKTRVVVILLTTFACVAILLGPWTKQKDYTREAADFFKPERLRPKNTSSM